MPTLLPPRVRISVSRSSTREPAPDAAAPAATGPVENARVLAVVVRCPPLIADSTARPTWVVE
ncbi:hypothetical protein [Burkholderia vietnamiensis]|uniref:hypothetical protein n=1 Tax=Burkholderia vietnamiensis TaxID=60552 RepID=UPI002159554B|nr:hypothetical protein [Burkholderia vietnamiensis]